MTEVATESRGEIIHTPGPEQLFLPLATDVRANMPNGSAPHTTLSLIHIESIDEGVGDAHFEAARGDVKMPETGQRYQAHPNSAPGTVARTASEILRLAFIDTPPL
jgi:hypothetical protein